MPDPTPLPTETRGDREYSAVQDSHARVSGHLVADRDSLIRALYAHDVLFEIAYDDCALVADALFASGAVLSPSDFLRQLAEDWPEETLPPFYARRWLRDRADHLEGDRA